MYRALSRVTLGCAAGIALVLCSYADASGDLRFARAPFMQREGASVTVSFGLPQRARQVSLAVGRHRARVRLVHSGHVASYIAVAPAQGLRTGVVYPVRIAARYQVSARCAVRRLYLHRHQGAEI